MRAISEAREAFRASREVRKGNVGLLISLAIAIGILVFVVAIMAATLGGLQGTQTTNSLPYNITGSGLSAMSTFASFFNVYVLAGVLVGIVSLFALIYKSKGGFS